MMRPSWEEERGPEGEVVEGREGEGKEERRGRRRWVVGRDGKVGAGGREEGWRERV